MPHSPTRTTTDDLISRLRQKRTQFGLTKREMARLADLHPNTLARFDKDDWAPAVSTLNRLEQVLLLGDRG